MTISAASLLVGGQWAYGQNIPSLDTNEFPQAGIVEGEQDVDLQQQADPVFAQPLGDVEEEQPAELTTTGRALPLSEPLPQRRAQREQQVPPVSVTGPDGAPTPLVNSRAIAEQSGANRSQDDPYVPLGLRAGSFTLFPVLTQSFGTTSNADFAANGSPGSFSQTDLRVTAVSDWSLHELRGEIGGNYQAFFEDDFQSLPNLDVNGELRLDISRDLTGRLGVSLNVTTESATSDNLTSPTAATVDERPLVATVAGFAEIERQVGYGRGKIRGTVTRTAYEDATLSDGSSFSQEDRSNTEILATGRFGYEGNAVLTPFVEADIGLRTFDNSVDRNGNQRDALLWGLRGGVAVQQSEKLNGEIMLGYSAETYDDARLETLDAITLNGTINWSPQRLTTITATAETSLTGSTNLNESGSVTYIGTLGAVQQLRPNLSLSARVLASMQNFVGANREDKTLQGQIGAQWQINRNASLFGNVGYETIDSSDPGSSYDAATAMMGVRIRR